MDDFHFATSSHGWSHDEIPPKNQKKKKKKKKKKEKLEKC
jgi:hypothetical protein